MRLYVYRCEAGHLLELEVPANVVKCPMHYAYAKRSWRDEAVGIDYHSIVADDRAREQTRTVLPTAEDYAGPDDPDGSKGLTAWNERHQPAEGNKHPLRPKVPRKSF